MEQDNKVNKKENINANDDELNGSDNKNQIRKGGSKDISSWEKESKSKKSKSMDVPNKKYIKDQNTKCMNKVLKRYADAQCAVVPDMKTCMKMCEKIGNSQIWLFSLSFYYF